MKNIKDFDVKGFLICLAITCMFFIPIAVVCAVSYEETEIEAIVLHCEKTFHPNEEDVDMADYYLSQGNYTMYDLYNDEAYEHGSYKYDITVNIDDIDYVIVRLEPYEIGETIIVTKLQTVSGTEYN